MENLANLASVRSSSPYAEGRSDWQSRLRGPAGGAIWPAMDKVADVEWRVTPGLTPYEQALAAMAARAAAIRAGQAGELVWLLEHPPLFTAGTSAAADELTNPMQFPVHEAGRGGRYTYHGPGQRVGYLMLDLEKRGRDIRRFVHSLEGWLIAALAALGVEARREPGRIGLWVGRGPDEAKIAAIGVRVKRWVTLHGFSVNVDPDLSHFAGIVPCGIADFGVTSLAALGRKARMAALDEALIASFPGFLAELRSRDKVP
jgi:lipoyl(octanoyl) transferase